MPKGTVLVTGITGSIGSEVALAFLKEGYLVRRAMRSRQKKSSDWVKRFPQYKNHWSFVTVEDTASPGAFDEAVQGVDYVAHLASPCHFAPNISVLFMTTKHFVQRLVCTTGHVFSVFLSRTLSTCSHNMILEDGWNPITYEAAKMTNNGRAIYGSSKTLAEKSAWDQIEENRPSWALTTLCSPVTFGPPNYLVTDLNSLNTSLSTIWELMSDTLDKVPRTASPVYVDVRDVALAHVRAIGVIQARNQRQQLVAGHYSNDQMAYIVHESRPELVSRVPETQGSPPPPHFKSNDLKAVRELGIQRVPFEQMVLDTVGRLIEIKDSIRTRA